MKYLDEEIRKYSKGDKYPFHMPGHKRQNMPDKEEDQESAAVWQGIYDLDITEIEGFDDLHEPSGLIRDIEEGFTKVYGACRAFLSVNGSTCGILAAVSSYTDDGDLVIADRMSHKSFYHAALLKDLDVRFVYPEKDTEKACHRYQTEAFLAAIEENPTAKAVYITSPTYEGYYKNIEAIAAAAHRNNMALIVDAAHGAHLGPSAGDMDPAIKAGADIVITSLHKMLPALTQTALILQWSSDPDRSADIRYYLDCFETSSPSYILMASAARCLRFLKNEGVRAYKAYNERLERLYARLSELKIIHVADDPDHDRSHIMLYGADGLWLAKELGKRYDIEVEMASPGYVIALSSVADTDEGFERLATALTELDEEALLHRQDSRLFAEITEQKAIRICKMKEAHRQRKPVRLRDSAGCIAAEEIMMYPPGIPLVVSGEQITKEMIEFISRLSDAGYNIRGARNGQIYVSMA